MSNVGLPVGWRCIVIVSSERTFFFLHVHFPDPVYTVCLCLIMCFDVFLLI